MAKEATTCSPWHEHQPPAQKPVHREPGPPGPPGPGALHPFPQRHGSPSPRADGEFDGHPPEGDGQVRCIPAGRWFAGRPFVEAWQVARI